MSQIHHTAKLIIVPIKVFYGLADKIEAEKTNVVWMFHTSRCGSTAWVQALHSLPGWTVFSEPHCMLYSIMYGDHGHYSAESFSKTQEYKQMVIAAIKMHVRHAPKDGSVFWKASLYDGFAIDVIREVFPRHKMLFAYRDTYPSITSYYKTFHNFNIMRWATEIELAHDPDDEEWWFHIPNTRSFTDGVDHSLCQRIIKKVRPKSNVEWYCFLWSGRASVLRRAIQNGAKIKPIKYDSLLENRRDTIAKVFDYLGVAAENVDIACEALNYDSQDGVAVVSRESRVKGTAAEWSKDEGVVKRCNMILEEFGLPDLQSTFDLPNSI